MSACENDYLEDKVYPVLRQALDNFIDQIKFSDEIQKHIEKIKEQKVIDENQIKRIEKEKLKKELGDDYFSSESEDNYGMDKEKEISYDMSSQQDITVNSKSNLINGEMHMKNGFSGEMDRDSEGLVSEEEFKEEVQSYTFNPLKEFINILEETNAKVKGLQVNKEE